ncbi:MAG: aldo/keto reductase [Bryobacterales bacterium]|nr:aldo/keto reductase [Bryobacterales bacterium]
MTPPLSRRAFLAAAAGLAATPSPAAVPEIERGGMVYRKLGKSDLYVSLLSFGSHTDPKYKVRTSKHVNGLNEEGQARRDRQILHSFDLGVNMVDTYENAGQWEPMARLMKGRRDKVLVSICRQFPMFVGENIDRAARLYGGHVDMYRIYIGGNPGLTERDIEDWDVLRKAKQAGKIRALGISTHNEQVMLEALREFEGLDYVMFPYNFIHARADYSQFLPEAVKQGVGLIAIKPLAAGSILKLDPKARPGVQPENEKFTLYQQQYRPLLPQVVAELTRSLNRLPEETLCQAALRFVYSRPFLTSAMPGMFDDHMIEENYQALSRARELSHNERDVLNAAARVVEYAGKGWLPPHYRWLDAQWRA